MTGTGFAYRTGRQKDKCPSFCQSSGVTARSANTPPRWMDNADSHRLEENITRKGEEVARKGRKLLKSTGKKETTTNLRHLLLPLTKPTHHLTRPPCPASCMGEEHSSPTNTPLPCPLLVSLWHGSCCLPQQTSATPTQPSPQAPHNI